MHYRRRKFTSLLLSVRQMPFGFLYVVNFSAPITYQWRFLRLLLLTSLSELLECFVNTIVMCEYPSSLHLWPRLTVDLAWAFLLVDHLPVSHTTMLFHCCHHRNSVEILQGGKYYKDKKGVMRIASVSLTTLPSGVDNVDQHCHMVSHSSACLHTLILIDYLMRALSMFLYVNKISSICLYHVPVHVL